MKILMVCLGNICRSPIAEGVMKSLIEANHLDWKVDSAATETYHIGEPPHPSSQKVCRLHHIDISQQRARLFQPTDMERYDLIYVMAEDVMKEVKRISEDKFRPEKVQYFLNELYPNQNKSVPDPWYGDESGYYPVFDLIKKGCLAIVKKYS